MRDQNAEVQNAALANAGAKLHGWKVRDRRGISWKRCMCLN